MTAGQFALLETASLFEVGTTEAEDGVGGGMMAVIIEAEEGEAISEFMGVAESEAGLESPPPREVVVDRVEAALRLLKENLFRTFLTKIGPFFTKKSSNLPSQFFLGSR